MSTSRTATHEFAAAADVYLHDVYLSEAFARALYIDGLGFERFELISSARTPDGGVERRIRVCPKSNAPAVVQKVIGSQEYEEHGTLAPGTRTWRYRIVPRTMADKIRITGAQVVTPVGDGRCRAVFDVTFDVGVFAVGSVIERYMAGQFDDNLARQAAFTREWLARQGR